MTCFAEVDFNTGLTVVYLKDILYNLLSQCRSRFFWSHFLLLESLDWIEVTVCQVVNIISGDTGDFLCEFQVRSLVRILNRITKKCLFSTNMYVPTFIFAADFCYTY